MMDPEVGTTRQEILRAALRKVWTRIPHCVLALALEPLAAVLGLLWYVTLGEPGFGLQGSVFLVGMFLVGAARRLKGRQMLIMLALGVLGCLWVNVVHPWLSPEGHWPHVWLALMAVPYLVLALGESLLSSRRSPRTCLWALLCVGAAVVLIHGVGWFLWGFKSVTAAPWTSSLHSTLWYPLRALAIWSLLPLGLYLARTDRRAVRVSAICGMVLLSGGYLFYMESLQFTLAEASLDSGGPFAKRQAIQLLGARGKKEDMDRIWAQIERDDWKGHEDFGGDRWRTAALSFVKEQDAPGAAKRLADLLRQHPELLLAEQVAEFLADRGRYEIAPVLIRYQLFDPPGRVERKKVRDAMLKMGFPRAAYPILVDEATSRGYYRRASQSYQMPEDSISRLKVLLSADAGKDLDRWAETYDAVIADLPTPCDAETVAETERIIRAYLRYNAAKTRLHYAVIELSLRWTGAAGYSEQIEQLKARRKSGPFTPEDISSLPGDQFEAVSAFADQVRAVREALAVVWPDLSVAAIDDLEREIDAYVENVDQAVARHLPSTPASQPATRPAE